VVVERDYSQGELRVVACVANETNMIAAYKAGMDLHARTGAKTAGMTYEQMMELEKTNEALFAELRQLAKAGNFGLLYGMGPEGFLIYATKNYGVKGLTLEKAKEFRDAFFEEYSGLLVYHDTYKKFAREHKYVPSPLGRIRHLPLVDSPNREVAAKEERRAINAPIQGCLSDMLIWAMSLEHKAGLTEIAPSFGAIHDAAYNYVPEDKVDEIIPQLLAVQENLPFEVVGWQPQLPFPADAKFGPNMADLTKFKKKG
jgi:DNA polymerase I-like protein with 3'-5' exonuclease and polymerase domains